MHAVIYLCVRLPRPHNTGAQEFKQVMKPGSARAGFFPHIEPLNTTAPKLPLGGEWAASSFRARSLKPGGSSYLSHSQSLVKGKQKVTYFKGLPWGWRGTANRRDWLGSGKRFHRVMGDMLGPREENTLMRPHHLQIIKNRLHGWRNISYI